MESKAVSNEDIQQEIGRDFDTQTDGSGHARIVEIASEIQGVEHVVVAEIHS